MRWVRGVAAAFSRRFRTDIKKPPWGGNDVGIKMARFPAARGKGLQPRTRPEPGLAHPEASSIDCERAGKRHGAASLTHSRKYGMLSDR